MANKIIYISAVASAAAAVALAEQTKAVQDLFDAEISLAAVSPSTEEEKAVLASLYGRQNDVLLGTSNKGMY